MVLCAREVNGEYFFISQAGDKVRLGSRLNMTEYTETHTFLVGWRLQDESDGSLVAKVRQISIRDEYVRNGEMVFAENIQYQTLRPSPAKTIHVTIEIKKCPTAKCDRQKMIDEREKQYVVDLCTSPLSK